MSEPTVTDVEIRVHAHIFDTSLFEYGGSAVAFLTMSDGSEETFAWFHDELTYVESDFVGKTMMEIRDMHRERDMKYLRSP